MIWTIFLLIIAVIWIVLGTTKFKIHPFLVLLYAAVGLGILANIPLTSILDSLTKGFGKTFENIGLLIVFGTLIGVFLESSGATLTIARFLIKKLHRLPLPFAISAIGYVVAIPVFCDSAFVILSSLNKSLARESRTPHLALTIALSTGLFAPHVLVPPTPGPLAAAAQLDLHNLLLLIFWGGLVALILVLIGALYAHQIGKRHRGMSEHSNQDKKNNPSIESNSEECLPGILASISPILIPIIMMASGTLIRVLPGSLNAIDNAMQFLASPNVALFTGLLIAMNLKVQKNNHSSNSATNKFQEGLKLAAPVLLITAMGGAFGNIIKELPLTEYLSQYDSLTYFGLLLPFFIAAVLKTAQGSSTVSIITTASIIFPILSQLGMTTELDKVWVIIAIGTGSMTVSHANDSYFWIVSQMGGIDVKTAYRHHTFATLIQGLSGLVVVLLLSALSSWWS
jgi:GntP family gluconate:H+ symporter